MGRQRKIQNMDIPKVGIRLLTQADELTEDEKQKQEEGWVLLKTETGIGTQMFARDPAEIKFENVAEPVVSEKRGSYHTTPEQRQEKIRQITDSGKAEGCQGVRT